MNFEEIVAELEKQEIDKDSFSDDFGTKKYPKAPYGSLEYYTRIVDNLGEVIRVYHYGGEGKGETYETVQYFKDHNVYIKLEGWYSSYDGVNFDDYDFEEVFPEEKTIVVYNSK